MPHVIYDNLTLDQFLQLPEAKPALEFLDGKVVQKVAAKQLARPASVFPRGRTVTARSFATARTGLYRAALHLRRAFGRVGSLRHGLGPNPSG